MFSGLILSALIYSILVVQLLDSTRPIRNIITFAQLSKERLEGLFLYDLTVKYLLLV